MLHLRLDMFLCPHLGPLLQAEPTGQQVFPQELKKKNYNNAWQRLLIEQSVRDQEGGNPKKRRRLPSWLGGKESACQYKRCEFDPWSGKMPHVGATKPMPHNS